MIERRVVLLGATDRVDPIHYPYRKPAVLSARRSVLEMRGVRTPHGCWLSAWSDRRRRGRRLRGRPVCAPVADGACRGRLQWRSGIRRLLLGGGPGFDSWTGDPRAVPAVEWANPTTVLTRPALSRTYRNQGDTLFLIAQKPSDKDSPGKARTRLVQID